MATKKKKKPFEPCPQCKSPTVCNIVKGGTCMQEVAKETLGSAKPGVRTGNPKGKQGAYK